MPETFHCVRCGACCRWEGPVRISETEADAIAAYLKIPVRDFIRDHTVLTADRRSLSLRENPDGSCCYYDPETRSCRIQAVKPKQCRDFPLVWNVPGWEKLCAGARTEQAEYPVCRGPVKLMAALVLVFGSVPFLNEIQLLPLVRGTLSPETFLEWWSAWLQNGAGIALLIFPVLTVLTMLVLVLGKLTRGRRYRLWLTGLLILLVSALFLRQHFTAALQFEALLLALGGAALWLSRPKPEERT